MWAAMIIIFSVSGYSVAEQIELAGGDILNGEIAQLTESNVILEHDDLGQLVISRKKVNSLSFQEEETKEPSLKLESQERMMLVGGDVIHGKISNLTDISISLDHVDLGMLEIPKQKVQSLTFKHAVLGHIEIPRSQIKSLGKDKPASAVVVEEKPTTTQVQKSQKEDEAEDYWLEPQFDRLNAGVSRLKKQGWSLATDFSITTSSGNTEEETTRFSAHLKRRLRAERLNLDMTYYHKTSDGDTTDNKFTAGVLQDWLNPGSRWFFFGLGRYDYDEFESWTHRGNIQFGPGYNLIDSDRMLLNLRAGAGGRKEWGSESDDPELEGLAGFDFEWKITKKQSFDTTVHYFPVLNDFDDYRTRSTLNWRYLLSKELNLSFIFGILHEFQSVVDPGEDDSDTRVHTGIQIRFE
jgi:putative salt-induced outer membrane protein